MRKGTKNKVIKDTIRADQRRIDLGADANARAIEHILAIESLCESLRANLRWQDPPTMLREGFIQIAKRAVRAQSELVSSGGAIR